MRPKLALLFLFALATICSAPSCSYKTYAQDDDAGIMTLAKGAGKIAYSRLSDLVLAECGQSYYTRETSPTHPAETYVYILKDIEDDATGDVWLFSGCVLTYDTDHLRWVTVGLAATLYAVNSKWALKSSSVSLGLPYMNVGNRYGLTYLEAETYFMVRVQAERKCCELNGSTFDESSYPYVNYINCDVWDTDGGGVNDIAEWVRGTANDDWTDDNPSGNACMCGACCRCKCECRKWDGSTCAGSTGEGGCDCHKDDDPEEECACAKYCCLDKCECKACKDKTEAEHGKHKNGSSTCAGSTGEGGCDCHKDDDPDEECASANYCCYHTCECKRCASLPAEQHSQHKNGSPTCTGSTGEGGCDCHKGDDPEEECACAKYCCYHTCKCKRCASLSAEQHSQHKNGLPTCAGTTGEGGCDCHTTTDGEKEDFDPPQQPNFEELMPEERKKFLSGVSENDPNSFSGALNRLRNELNQKFKIDVMSSWFDADFSGDLPRFDVPIPNGMGTIIIDFATLKTYSEMFMLRSVLAFGVFWYFISAVIKDVKKFL